VIQNILDHPRSCGMSIPKAGLDGSSQFPSSWDDTMAFEVFDHFQLSEAAIVDHYDRLIQRGNRACEAVHKAYGRDRPPVQMRYVAWGEFNASAGMGDEAYEIHISHSIPLLLLILFQRILSDDEVMPWLGLNESHRTDFSVPFVVDLKRFDISEGWHIQLSEIVRRQGFWNRWRPKLREGLAHLVGLIMRLICGEAIAGFRWSSV